MPAPSAPLNLNMDGQEWLFTDSARWQQSFESWPGPGPNSPVFIFNDRLASNSPASTGSNAGVNGGHTSSMNGAGNTASGDAAMGAYGFEGLGVSLQDGGWLPGLD